MASTLGKEDGYALGRNISSRIRLNQQHFMYHKMFGYLLHPTIPRGDNMKIADIATGTGIWMLDVMSEFPATTTFQGFDISLSQQPPNEWLPKNVSFSVLDLFQDIPEALKGTFDVINIRLVMLVVKDDEIVQILDKFKSLLKPGGWLQWTEANNKGDKYLDMVKAQPQLSGSAMTSLHQKLMLSNSRLQPSWPLELPEHMRAAGFNHVQADTKSSEDSLPWLAFFNDVTIATYQEAIAKMPSGSARSDLEQLYSQATQEAWAGTAWNPVRINAIGQKPL